MTDKDGEFCLALNKLWRDRMQARFGIAILRNLGPGLVTGNTNTTLEKIAECARAHKLGRSLDDLYEETNLKWRETWELGDQASGVGVSLEVCRRPLSRAYAAHIATH